jgi:hypothetical protein
VRCSGTVLTCTLPNTCIRSCNDQGSRVPKYRGGISCCLQRALVCCPRRLQIRRGEIPLTLNFIQLLGLTLPTSSPTLFSPSLTLLAPCFQSLDQLRDKKKNVPWFESSHLISSTTPPRSFLGISSGDCLFGSSESRTGGPSAMPISNHLRVGHTYNLYYKVMGLYQSRNVFLKTS